MNHLRYLLLFSLAVSSVPAAEEHQLLRVRADPDTKCSETYKKSPTKETCLQTEDHFFRPCVYCQDKSDSYCYNTDEAKWARIFGEKCEAGPSSDASQQSS
jgi:hypothetical protein